MSMVIEVVAIRLLAPAVIVALAIIVKGYADVGDGFSAGVVVALAVALRYITQGRYRAERALPILRRATGGIAIGLLVALASGFFPVLWGDPPFTHVPAPGEPVVAIGTLELVSAVAFDVGVFLLVTSSLVALIRTLAGLTGGERR